MSESVWWKSGIVYQIYPRSFQDSNGDGIGDLEGIRSRLDYLVLLGVDAIWLSPFYPSPMADFGYDIADYCNVDPQFGSLSDFDALLDDVHGHGLKLIVDLVPNHTSDRHPWFVESRASRANPKRDWYLWRDPGPDGPPNNWLSNFGGPAWTFDESTGQYYYHAFLKEQPDLNWRNPEVRAAMYDVMRFWLERGVDGFRVDVIYHLIKDDQFRDNPVNRFVRATEQSSHAVIPIYTTDRPEVQRVIAEMRRVTDEFGQRGAHRVLIGEIYLPLHRLVAYYGRSETGMLEGVQLPFNFQLLSARWEARAIEKIVTEYESALPEGAWPNWVLGNHDKPRIASRVGIDQARLAAVLLLTLRGTPTMYYGDEIGMHDVPIPSDEVQDPFERNEPDKGAGRDPERTPMQWDDSAHAGFTAGKPWLRVDDNYRARNVAALDADPRSILTLYRRLIALRRRLPALTQGAWEAIETGGELFAFARAHRNQRLVVIANFSAQSAELGDPILPRRAKILLSTHLDREGLCDGPLVLRAAEAIITTAS